MVARMTAGRVDDAGGAQPADSPPRQRATAGGGCELRDPRGELFALVGESGSGKSITALAIMRLLDAGFERSTGEVWLAGREGRQELLALPEAVMQRMRGDRIGMIFRNR